MRLAYTLDILNGSFIFTIHKQHWKFMCEDGDKTVKPFHAAKNGWTIASATYPTIDFRDKIVFLRGSDKTKHSVIFTQDVQEVTGKSFNLRNSQALILEIEEAIRDWAENWEGWQESSFVCNYAHCSEEEKTKAFLESTKD